MHPDPVPDRSRGRGLRAIIGGIGAAAMGIAGTLIARNTTLSTNGSQVTAGNAGYCNGVLNAGQTTSSGFDDSWAATSSAPTLGCTAT